LIYGNDLINSLISCVCYLFWLVTINKIIAIQTNVVGNNEIMSLHWIEGVYFISNDKIR